MALTLKGRNVSLAWLKPPAMPEDGNMSLFEHLRELRYRLVVSALAIVLLMALSAFFYDPLYHLLLRPWESAVAELKVDRPGIDTQLVNSGVTSPFILALKIVGLSGLLLSSPIWLWQLWSFIVPGLLAQEKKWAMIFVGMAVPLFLAGVATGYFIMPKGIEVLISFTPENVEILNMLAMEEFLGFLMRVMLVFGISYLIPLVLLLLNFLGVVKAAHLKKFRPFIIFGSFVFAAVATPSTDPFSMLALAAPLTLLCMIAEVIAYFHDKRTGRDVGDGVSQDKVLRQMEEQDAEEARAKAEQAEEDRKSAERAKLAEESDKAGDSSGKAASAPDRDSIAALLGKDTPAE
ncbi:twin-arginine translocase subunit TatC [Propionibacteriaceae bacterium Y1685]|uniref:twin-arginine translocase subunit TatC n=1 Tax=Microlunatus sp. Y1700 TaxID=3418487 RepID=UPI003B762A7F